MEYYICLCYNFLNFFHIKAGVQKLILPNFLKRKLHDFKTYIKYFPKRIQFLFYGFLPINKKKIVFSNFSGKRCGDSPFSIFCFLQRLHPDWDFIWLYNPAYSPKIPDGARGVCFDSGKMIYELSTSSVWIDSHYKPIYTRKRKNQLYIQTWHGGVSLKSERMLSEKEPDFVKQKRILNFDILPDYVITDSNHTTSVFQNFFCMKEKYLKIGNPCDDIFFSKTDENLIKKELSLPQDKKIVLYCPTWREDGDTTCYSLNTKKVLSALNERFGSEWILLVRLHPLVMKTSPNLFKADNKTIFDATSHEAINDILYISDILITDYSGVMGTFMTTGRPIFLFQSDYQKYLNMRGLDFSNDELPFPSANDSNELEIAIRNFNEQKYTTDLIRFKKDIGFVENNNSTEKICTLIENFIRTGIKEYESNRY